MINTKSFHVIDKHTLRGRIHVVGVGALGSLVVSNLVRLNLASKIKVYDGDVVEEKNLNNQAYLHKHIGMTKVDAIKDLCSSIDTEAEITTQFGMVDRIVAGNNDIVILAIDNFESRGKILSNFAVTEPLVISGGVSSIGGNFEVVRGYKAYQRLSKEYLALPSGQEYSEDDLTPCGSPISIYHRINIAASLICEEVVQQYKNIEEVSYNTLFDIPNHIIIKN